MQQPSRPGMPIDELDLQERTTDHSRNATVASAEAVPPSKHRTALWAVNISDTRIHLALGRDASVTTGIPLNANGGAFEINKTNLYKGAISVIHGGAGNKIICIVELTSRYAY